MGWATKIWMEYMEAKKYSRIICVCSRLLGIVSDARRSLVSSAPAAKSPKVATPAIDGIIPVTPRLSGKGYAQEGLYMLPTGNSSRWVQRQAVEQILEGLLAGGGLATALQQVSMYVMYAYKPTSTGAIGSPLRRFDASPHALHS